jgi:hypothetical protein
MKEKENSDKLARKRRKRGIKNKQSRLKRIAKQEKVNQEKQIKE